MGACNYYLKDHLIGSHVPLDCSLFVVEDGRLQSSEEILEGRPSYRSSVQLHDVSSEQTLENGSLAGWPLNCSLVCWVGVPVCLLEYGGLMFVSECAL